MYGIVLLAVGGVPMVFILLGEIVSIAKVPLIPAVFLLGVPVIFALSMEGTLRALERPNKSTIAPP